MLIWKPKKFISILLLALVALVPAVAETPDSKSPVKNEYPSPDGTHSVLTETHSFGGATVTTTSIKFPNGETINDSHKKLLTYTQDLVEERPTAHANIYCDDMDYGIDYGLQLRKGTDTDKPTTPNAEK